MLLRFTFLTLCSVVFATAQDLASQAVGVLQAQCASCHAGAVAMSGFRVDSREALLRGGQRGVAVKPTDSSNSLLIQAIRHAGKLTMPPGKKLPPENADLLAKWIDSGAPWPAAIATSTKASKWWSFQPPVRPSVPNVEGGLAPIDAFIADRLRLAKLQ